MDELDPTPNIQRVDSAELKEKIPNMSCAERREMGIINQRCIIL